MASSNGNIAHVENGQTTAGSQSVYSRTTTIVIDPETGEARNAITGETMEVPLQSPRPTPTTPPPVPIAEFQHLAIESDLKVWKSLRGCIDVVYYYTLVILIWVILVCFSWLILSPANDNMTSLEVFIQFVWPSSCIITVNVLLLFSRLICLALCFQGIAAALDKAVTPEGAIKNHEYVPFSHYIKGLDDTHHCRQKIGVLLESCSHNKLLLLIFMNDWL